MKRSRTIAKSLISLVPEGLPTGLAPLANETDRIHESVLWSAQIQFEQMKLWRALNALLGIPATALAAFAGGSTLAATELSSTPGILALIAAAFGAALTTLNPSRRVAQAQSAANAYLGIQTDARQLLCLDLATLDPTTAREKLQELTARRDEVNRTADPPGAYAYLRAKRNITKGRQKYRVDEKVE